MNISVIIPTFNRYIFLARAVTSIYNQTVLPKEIIVIDDGSTDNTSQIQKDFPDIIYIYQKNSGVSSARHIGIKRDMFDLIAFLDSDDEWDCTKLEKQIKFHQEHPHILMSYTDEKWVRDGVEVKVPKKYQKYSGYIFDRCLSHCIIAPSASLVHCSIFEKVNLFDENLEVCEDYDLWLRIAINYEIGLVEEKLITKYAGHENQLSFKYWGMDRFRVKSLEKLVDTEKKEIVRSILGKKYKLLLKGAIKYDKITDIKEYEEKITIYE